MVASVTADVTTPNLGPLAPLQPLIAQLREHAAQQNGGRIGAYAFGAHQQGEEVYMFGVDGAGREFAFRFEPAAFEDFVRAAVGVRELCAERRRTAQDQ